MWMASEMILSSEWKTSELRQVAIALRVHRRGVSKSISRCGRAESEDETGADSRSETAECQAEARLEQDGAAGEDPELHHSDCQLSHLMCNSGKRRERT